MICYTLFFIRHFPSAWHFEDTDYFTGEVDELLRGELFQRLGAFGPEQQFFAKEKTPIAGIGFRSEGPNERDALAKARDRAEALIDALSLMAYDHLPKISNLMLLLFPTETDARVLLFSPEAFIEFGETPPTIEPEKDARAEQITSMILPLLDLAAGTHAKSGSALGEQLAYALKMFRHGSSTGAYAIEFICKFTAMESLVCGGHRGSKKANLVERLGRLFPNDARLTSAYFNELWDARNAAVHEARGFHHEIVTNSVRVQGHLENLNRIVLSVVTYAAAHLDVADSVRSLWALPPGYQLPSFTQTFRPQRPGAMRLEAKRVAFNLNVTLPNARTIFKKFFDRNETRRP